MTDWKIGHILNVKINKRIFLKVERIEEKKTNNNLNIKNFKFKVNIKSINKENTDLILDGKNIDYVREALIEIFQNVKKTFKRNEGPAYIQVNLSFDGLKKLYLKSGIVPLFDKHSKNVVFWLINQLDQVEQSSENLVFTKNFVVDFIVVKTKQPKGKFNIITTNNYKSKFSKLTFLSLSQIKLNIFFMNLLKEGLVDMKLLFDEFYIDEISNCQLISIYFGVLYHDNQCDMKKTITFIKKNFNNVLEFEKKFISDYKLLSREYLQKQKLTYVLSHISKLIKKDILIFLQKNEFTRKLIFTTSLFKDSLPIKLLLSDDHIRFIYDQCNLQEKNKTFCDFCLKSFQNIKLHKCKRKKCINCNLYLKCITTDVKENICASDSVKDINVQCLHCKKLITNKECFQRHQLLSVTMCKRIQFCIKCNNYYTHREVHLCGEFFCPKCFTTHPKQIFCAVKQKKKKIISNKVFICDISFQGENIESITLTEFHEKDELTVYRFIKKDLFYSKSIISKNNLVEIKTDRIDFSASLNIENVLQELEILNCCPLILLETRSLRKLIWSLDISHFKICSRDKVIYKLIGKYYSIYSIESYVDIDKVYICKLLNIQVCPLYLIPLPNDVRTCLNNNINNVEIQHYLKNYKNSDIDMFEYIMGYTKEIKRINSLSLSEYDRNCSINTLIVFQKALDATNSFVQDLTRKMNTMLSKQEQELNTLFSFKSFSSCVFTIFLSCLEKQKIPTLPSCYPGNIKNTSKYEISFCNILNIYHSSKYKNHTIKSYVNNDGRQYQKGVYTCDWYCKECKTAIFIEGSFKYVCNTHGNKGTDKIKKRKIECLAKRGKRKRKNFISNARKEIKNVIVVGQCCIEQDEYNFDFVSSNLYYKNFGKDVLEEIKNYEKSDYDRMNYQRCMQPPITVFLKKEFKSNGISKASKFDIDSAYLSVLTHDSFELPTSNIPNKILVNNDANKFFHNLNTNCNDFAMVQGFVISDKKYTLPFLPIRSEANGINYSHCYECKIENDCKHTDKKRGFYTQGYLRDFLYIKSMGYNVRVNQLIYFPSKHNEDLHLLASELMLYRKDECKFVRKISKQAALIGLGRFALNVGKSVSLSNNEILETNQELCLAIEKNEIESIDVLKNYVVSHKKQKISNYENAKISSKLNCSSLLFGSVSNYVRLELFRIYRYIQDNFKNTYILRLDTDSLMIAFEDISESLKFNEYMKTSKFKYKIEVENIKLLINNGRKSYYYRTDEKQFLKVTGLSISVYERNNVLHCDKFKFKPA